MPSSKKVFLAVSDYPYLRTSLSLFTDKLGVIYPFKDAGHSLYQTLFPQLTLAIKNDGHFQRVTPAEILKLPQTINYINSHFSNHQVYIVPTRSSKTMDVVCKKNGWKILANEYSLSDQLEDKKFFRELTDKLQLPQIPQVQLTIQRLLITSYESIQQEVGSSFVFYFKKSRKEGGLQTQFVFNKEQFENLLLKTEHLELKSSVIISKFINGPSLSMLGCVTKYGVLSGSPQLQLIDIDRSVNPNWGKGIFCGHDWQAAQNFPQATPHMSQALQTIGEYLNTKKYRGIFGIDFIYDKKTHQTYALECNPRYTGSFPVYTFLEKLDRQYPLEYFHFMELSNQEYPYENFQQYKLEEKKYLSGSHLNLFNNLERTITIKKSLQPGLYSFTDKGKIAFLKETIDNNLLDKNKFLLLGGLKEKDVRVDANLRIGKVIFNQSISDQDCQLLEKINLVIDNIRSQIY